MEWGGPPLQRPWSEPPPCNSSSVANQPSPADGWTLYHTIHPTTVYKVLAFDKLPVTLWYATELITTELDAKQKKKRSRGFFTKQMVDFFSPTNFSTIA